MVGTNGGPRMVFESRVEHLEEDDARLDSKDPTIAHKVLTVIFPSPWDSKGMKMTAS